jgi:hypothetical protein
MTAHNRKRVKADKSAVAARVSRTLHEISLLILLCLLKTYA